jgi:hypothetical protein
MKRLLVLAPAALLLAACGADTCNSSAATPQNASTAPSCTLPAGQQVTINVALCSKCQDSSPSCQAGFDGTEVTVSPAVQQCQADQGCAVNGCNVSVPTASCTLTIPTTAGSSVPLRVVGDTLGPVGTITISPGASTTCSL